MDITIEYMTDIKIISLGGSIAVPDNVDNEFLKKFHSVISEYLSRKSERKLIIVVGGGGPARAYQKSYREIAESPDAVSQDLIGIAATRLNGELLKAVFADLCLNDVVTDPTAVSTIDGKVLVAAGWKPGFSTDNDAVLLAERFGADTVINLSNIKKVYTADPNIDPDAVPLDKISWKELITLVGDKWVPGRNVPFDPVATKRGAELRLKVITAEGRDIENLVNLLEERPFEGTVIGPE